MIDDSSYPGDSDSAPKLDRASALRTPPGSPEAPEPSSSRNVFSLHAPAVDPLSGDAAAAQTGPARSQGTETRVPEEARRPAAAVPSDAASDVDEASIDPSGDTAPELTSPAAAGSPVASAATVDRAPAPEVLERASQERAASATIRTHAGDVGGDGPSTGRPADANPQEETPDERLVGTMLSGRYLLEAQIGEGAMGAVFLATHTLIKKKVAVKVLHPDIARDEEIQARFQREAQAAAHIDHRNICAATDFGQTDAGMFFLVMEYLDGQTLEEVIEAGVLPPSRVARIVDQIGSALQRAHDLGIVHRDLKPENIFLVERDGERDVVKIVDFGIARVYLEIEDEQSEQSTRLTQAGMVYGTPHYLSPEQAAGEPVTPRSDLYAVGVMMFEMLTGKRPFKGNLGQLLAMHMTREPPAFSDVAPEVRIPDRLEAAVRHLMAKLPEDRVADAGELRRLVNPWLDGPTSGLLPLGAVGGSASPKSGASSGAAKIPGQILDHAKAGWAKAKPWLQDRWAWAKPRLQDLWARLLRLDPPVVIGAAVALLFVTVVITAIALSGGDDTSGSSDGSDAESEVVADGDAAGDVEEDGEPVRKQGASLDALATDADLDVVALLADEDIDQALRLIRAGDPESGLELLRAQTPKHADDPAFDAVLASALAAAGEAEEAMFTVKRLVDEDPSYMDQPRVREVILEVFTKRKKRDADPAIELLESRMTDGMADAIMEIALSGPMRDNSNLRKRIRNLFDETDRLEAFPKWKQLSFEMRLHDRHDCDDRFALVKKIVAHGDPRTLPVIRLQESQTPLRRNVCMEDELPNLIRELESKPPPL